MYDKINYEIGEHEMRLIYSGTDTEVKISDKTICHNLGEVIVTEIIKPKHGGSTGRVYVKYDDYAPVGYYPSVINAEWIEREDQD